MADYVTAITAVMTIEFPFTDLISWSLGQIAIFSTVLSMGRNFALSFFRM